jgi:hypothetical protein
MLGRHVEGFVVQGWSSKEMQKRRGEVEERDTETELEEWQWALAELAEVQLLGGVGLGKANIFCSRQERSRTVSSAEVSKGAVVVKVGRAWYRKD